MADTYLGALNLAKLKTEDALATGIALQTALKLGMKLDVKLAELKAGQKIEFWLPILHFYAVPLEPNDATD